MHPSFLHTLDPTHYYIITAIVGFFILILIIILSSCIVCIFRYHFKHKESHLGRMLRRQFSRDPSAQILKYARREPSPRQIEEQHFQGTDTPPILYTNTDVYLGNGNHQLGTNVNKQNHIYNISQYSGVSSYSGLSGVSQNHGSHKMPHYKEPSVVYYEDSGVQLDEHPAGTVGGKGVLQINLHSYGPAQCCLDESKDSNLIPAVAVDKLISHTTPNTEPNHQLTSLAATGTNLGCVTQSDEAIVMQDQLSTTDASSTTYYSAITVPCPILANLPGTLV